MQMRTRVASTSITISNIYCDVTPHRTFLLLLDSQQHMLREDSYAELFPLDFQAMNPSLNLFALYAPIHLDTLSHKHIPHTDVFHALLDLLVNYYAADRNDALFVKSYF